MVCKDSIAGREDKALHKRATVWTAKMVINGPMGWRYRSAVCVMYYGTGNAMRRIASGIRIA